MADTATISTIDEESRPGQVVTYVDLSINGNPYNISVISDDNAVSIANAVRNQAESFKLQVNAAPVAAQTAPSVQSLVGEVIDL